MTSQKLENLLNLALNSAEDEREKSLNLNVGYDPLDREWDLIIKYSVNLDRVRKIASKVTELQMNMQSSELQNPESTSYREFRKLNIVDKTETAVFSGGRRKACVLYQCGTGYTPFSVWTGNIGCNHRFGNRLCEYRFSKCGRKHEDSVSVGSVSESGRWGNSTVGYSIGVEYTKGQIDEALNAQTVSEQRRLVRSQDISGHGTAVAGVAAGNGSNSGGRYAGVAMQSELIVVKLGNPIQEDSQERQS